MKPLRWAGGLLAVAVALTVGADQKKEDGFTPLFNGKDLTGWVNVNCAPGTFFVKDGEIVTTGKPTGFLRTERQYENFVLELEWMHVNKKEAGNSGVFIWGDPLPAVGTPFTRGIEVQVLVNLEKEGFYTSHGDVFSIQGATCKPDRPHPNDWARCLPSERRCKGGGEWNHYRIEAKDGAIKLHVNGKEVSGVSECRPRKGYLALESEGAECHFRNIKIRELPSSNPKPEEVAQEAKDFKNLFTGLDLSGWRVDDEAKKHWQPRDWMLHYGGKGKELRTEKEFGDAEFIVDFRFPKKDGKPCAIVLRDGPGGGIKLTFTPQGKWERNILGHDIGWGKAPLSPVGQWNRLRGSIEQGGVQLTLNGKKLEIGEGKRAEGGPPALPPKGPFILRPEGEMDFANLFVRELK
jgi:hypothetical protein